MSGDIAAAAMKVGTSMQRKVEQSAPCEGLKASLDRRRTKKSYLCMPHFEASHSGSLDLLQAKATRLPDRELLLTMTVEKR